MYLLFGGLTTLVNIVFFWVSRNLFLWDLVVSTILAWFVSVIFAYVTNKLFVFESRSFAPKVMFPEIGAFFAARLFSGLLDLGIMYLFVDILHWHEMLMKILSNVLVIILNYLFSKLFIFKKPSSKAK